MNKLPFDRSYFEGASEDYLDGIRPGDPPRIGLFWIGGAVLFGFVWWAAVHVF